MGMRGRKRKSHESGQEKKMMKERIESINFLFVRQHQVLERITLA